MKKISFLIVVILTVSSLYSQVKEDSIYSLYNVHQKEITNIKSAVTQMNNVISMLKTENRNLSNELSKKQCEIDSIKNVVLLNSENIKATADELGLQIKETNDFTSKGIEDLSSGLHSKTIWGVVAIVVFAIILIVSIVLAIVFHRKEQKMSDEKIAELKRQSDELNEKILAQLSDELKEILSTMAKTQTQSSSSEPDHSLVKTLADRITFMEMTLFKMDSSVKGYKQLTKSISQMKDNLRANGYELVDMLGKDYNEGMKVTANFVEDENLDEGKQIITGIIKPQINYNGVMIQAAQITVSQN